MRQHVYSGSTLTEWKENHQQVLRCSVHVTEIKASEAATCSLR